MDTTMPNMAISGYGTANRAGVPAYDNNGGVRTVGGFISQDNTLPAKFGLAMCATTAAPDKLVVGQSAGGANVFKGILMNRQSVNQQSPAHADYLLNGMPADVIYHGGVWVKITTGTPTIGAAVSYTNATGELAIGGGTAIPNCKVVAHDAATGLTQIYLS